MYQFQILTNFPSHKVVFKSKNVQNFKKLSSNFFYLISALSRQSFCSLKKKSRKLSHISFIKFLFCNFCCFLLSLHQKRRLFVVQIKKWCLFCIHVQNVYLKSVYAILQVSARINKRVHQSTPHGRY